MDVEHGGMQSIVDSHRAELGAVIHLQGAATYGVWLGKSRFPQDAKVHSAAADGLVALRHLDGDTAADLHRVAVKTRGNRYM